MTSCGNPVAEADALMTRRNKYDQSRICVKCRVNQGQLVIRHTVYCKECFFPLVTYKFKRRVEDAVFPKEDGRRSRNKKASGNLMLGFSGGIGSTVLMDVISRTYCSTPSSSRQNSQKGTEHPRNKKSLVWPTVSVCYVEICSAFAGMRDKTDETRQAVSRYDEFEFIPLRLEDAFDSGWWHRVGGSHNFTSIVDTTNEDLHLLDVQGNEIPRNPVESLRIFLASLPTQTAVATAIQNLIKVLLLHTARSSRCSQLLLGTSLTTLSISLISSISQGAGFTVKEEADENWVSHSHPHATPVKVIRPLQDVGIKECTAWAWWSGILVVGREKIPGSELGIGGLTKDFIIGLEKDYPSTVSTISRTCAKLTPKDVSSLRCLFCERPMQGNAQSWKSRTAIRAFPEISQQTTPHDGDEKSRMIFNSSVHLSLTPHLCYACHTTLTSRSSRGGIAKHHTTGTDSATVAVPLPIWIHPQPLRTSARHSSNDAPDGLMNNENEVWARRKLSSEDTREVLASFLLDDSP